MRADKAKDWQMQVEAGRGKAAKVKAVAFQEERWAAAGTEAPYGQWRN